MGTQPQAQFLTDMEARLDQAIEQRRKCVDALAHYTSSQCFRSMLNSGEIWLSPVSTMNDVQEVEGGALAIAAHIRNRSELKGRAGSLLSEAINHMWPEFRERTYAFCLSEHTDPDGLLSMWRAYGSDGNGVCVVLNAGSFLRTDNRPFPVQCMPVCYDRPDQFEFRIQEFIDPFISALQAAPELVEDSDLILLVIIKLLYLAMAKKHPGFTEENEVRLVHNRIWKDALPAGISYGVRDGEKSISPVLKIAVRPYPDANMSDISWDGILREVIVGPSHTASAQAAAIKDILAEKNLSHIAVRCSEIPYRSNK